MTVYIDGKEINTQEEFHKRIKDVLKFPNYYGENLDALWDCLTAWIELPINIVWNNFDVSVNKLGDFVYKVKSVLDSAEKEIPGFNIRYN